MLLTGYLAIVGCGGTFDNLCETGVRLIVPDNILREALLSDLAMSHIPVDSVGNEICYLSEYDTYVSQAVIRLDQSANPPNTITVPGGAFGDAVLGELRNNDIAHEAHTVNSHIVLTVTRNEDLEVVREIIYRTAIKVFESTEAEP